jgi:hypothetical protein
MIAVTEISAGQLLMALAGGLATFAQACVFIILSDLRSRVVRVEDKCLGCSESARPANLVAQHSEGD